MNDLIKTLAQQAGEEVVNEVFEEYMLTETSDGATLQVPAIFIEKLAETMVKKFDDILVLEYLDCVGNKDKQAAERIDRLREKVKTYFGVEE